MQKYHARAISNYIYWDLSVLYIWEIFLVYIFLNLLFFNEAFKKVVFFIDLFGRYQILDYYKIGFCLYLSALLNHTQMYYLVFYMLCMQDKDEHLIFLCVGNMWCDEHAAALRAVFLIHLFASLAHNTPNQLATWAACVVLLLLFNCRQRLCYRVIILTILMIQTSRHMSYKCMKLSCVNWAGATRNTIRCNTTKYSL